MAPCNCVSQSVFGEFWERRFGAGALEWDLWEIEVQGNVTGVGEAAHEKDIEYRGKEQNERVSSTGKSETGGRTFIKGILFMLLIYTPKILYIQRYRCGRTDYKPVNLL